MSCRHSLWTVLGALLFAGCGRDEQITQYTIPKPESIQLPSEKPAGADSTSTPRPERMLGAIVPRGEQTWFFKLSGQPDRVSSQADMFREFVRSLRFGSDGTPKWVLPAGWTQQPGSGMRFATILADEEKPPLELTVIALPTTGTTPQEAVLANVNRWRGQLSLPPTTDKALPDESETVTLAEGEVATLVDYTGTTKGGGMSPPFAGGGMTRPFPTATAQGSGSGSVPFTAEAPEEWTPGSVSGMRKAAYAIEDNGRQAELTVIDLAREAGDRLANVNRWRGQMGLEPVNADALKLEPVDVGGERGDFVELTGSRGDSILGVIVDREDKTWFFKLQGPSPIANAQKEKFLAYVQSVKWK